MYSGRTATRKTVVYLTPDGQQETFVIDEPHNDVIFSNRTYYLTSEFSPSIDKWRDGRVRTVSLDGLIAAGLAGEAGSAGYHLAKCLAAWDKESFYLPFVSLSSPEIDENVEGMVPSLHSLATTATIAGMTSGSIPLSQMAGLLLEDASDLSAKAIRLASTSEDLHRAFVLALLASSSKTVVGSELLTLSSHLDDVEAFPRLTSLKFKDCTDASATAARSLLAKATSLKHLSFEGCDLSNMMEGLSSHKDLESLSICHCWSDENVATWMVPITKLTALVTLHVEDFTVPQNSHLLAAIGNRLHHLEDLSISGMALTSKDLEKLASIKGLTSLSVGSCSHLTAAILLAPLRQLTTLQLDSLPVTFIKKQFLYELSSHGASLPLVKLAIVNCVQFTLHCVFTTVAKFDALRELSLKGSSFRRFKCLESYIDVPEDIEWRVDHPLTRVLRFPLGALAGVPENKLTHLNCRGVDLDRDDLDRILHLSPNLEYLHMKDLLTTVDAPHQDNPAYNFNVGPQYYVQMCPHLHTIHYMNIWSGLDEVVPCELSTIYRDEDRTYADPRFPFLESCKIRTYGLRSFNSMYWRGNPHLIPLIDFSLYVHLEHLALFDTDYPNFIACLGGVAPGTIPLTTLTLGNCVTTAFELLILLFMAPRFRKLRLWKTRFEDPSPAWRSTRFKNAVALVQKERGNEPITIPFDGYAKLSSARTSPDSWALKTLVLNFPDLTIEILDDESARFDPVISEYI